MGTTTTTEANTLEVMATAHRKRPRWALADRPQKSRQGPRRISRPEPQQENMIVIQKAIAGVEAGHGQRPRLTHADVDDDLCDRLELQVGALACMATTEVGSKL